MKTYKPKKQCKMLQWLWLIKDKMLIVDILFSFHIQSPHSAAWVSIVLAGNFWEQIGHKTEEDLESSVQPEAWDSISDLKQVIMTISFI